MTTTTRNETAYLEVDGFRDPGDLGGGCRALFRDLGDGLGIYIATDASAVPLADETFNVTLQDDKGSRGMTEWSSQTAKTLPALLEAILAAPITVLEARTQTPTTDEHETLYFELIRAFHGALDAHRQMMRIAELEVLEVYPSAKVLAGRQLQAEVRQSAAFDLARNYGWDATADDEFLRWAAQATEHEHLTEGLRRALNNCTLDAGPTAQEDRS